MFPIQQSRSTNRWSPQNFRKVIWNRTIGGHSRVEVESPKVDCGDLEVHIEVNTVGTIIEIVRRSGVIESSLEDLESVWCW